jgi:hypothetical protein
MITKQNETIVAKDGVQKPMAKRSAFSRLLKEGIMKIPCVRKKEMLALAHNAAGQIIKEIKERQVNAIYATRYGSQCHYDDPSLDGIAISQDAKYAVIVIRKMIDYYPNPGLTGAEGAELAYSAYKVGLDGKPVLVASEHGMQYGDDYPEIKISGVSGAGIALEKELDAGWGTKII